MACMTDGQLQELHKDIESGLVMIVEKKHYYDLQAENKRLKGEKEQAVKFLEEALPHIECKNHFQSGLITAIGTFLNALKETQ